MGVANWVNSVSFTKATEIARIRFNAAQYVYHRDAGGKKTVALKSRQKKAMMNLLQATVIMPGVNDEEDEEENDDALSQKEKEQKEYERNCKKLRSMIDNGWKLLIYSHNLHSKIDEKKMIDVIFNGAPAPANMIPLDLEMPDYNNL